MQGFTHPHNSFKNKKKEKKKEGKNPSLDFIMGVAFPG